MDCAIATPKRSEVRISDSLIVSVVDQFIFVQLVITPSLLWHYLVQNHSILQGHSWRFLLSCVVRSSGWGAYLFYCIHALKKQYESEPFGIQQCQPWSSPVCELWDTSRLSASVRQKDPLILTWPISYILKFYLDVSISPPGWPAGSLYIFSLCVFVLVVHAVWDLLSYDWKCQRQFPSACPIPDLLLPYYFDQVYCLISSLISFIRP